MKDKDLFGNDFEYKNPEGNQIPGRNKSGGFINNPMHLVYGETKGLEVCKNCVHFVRKEYSKTYFKCSLRGNVDKCSTKSDHLASWRACGKFEDNNSGIRITDIQYK